MTKQNVQKFVSNGVCTCPVSTTKQFILLYCSCTVWTAATKKCKFVELCETHCRVNRVDGDLLHVWVLQMWLWCWNVNLPQAINTHARNTVAKHHKEQGKGSNMCRHINGHSTLSRNTFKLTTFPGIMQPRSQPPLNNKLFSLMTKTTTYAFVNSLNFPWQLSNFLAFLNLLGKWSLVTLALVLTEPLTVVITLYKMTTQDAHKHRWRKTDRQTERQWQTRMPIAQEVNQRLQQNHTYSGTTHKSAKVSISATK